MTAHGTTETAIQATKSGAYDYLLKPFEIPEFIELVERAMKSCRLMTEPVELGGTGDARDAMIGNSRGMQAIYKEIGRIASKPVNVLIRGETGTGKELIARAIHNRSKRSKRAFIRMNCAAIPPSLIASELFGHEKGSFTGAAQRRPGRFESADGGTIFLDEVGELPLEAQVALLRVLQEREFERVGGSQTVSVDVRVIAATNRDLSAAIAELRKHATIDQN